MAQVTLRQCERKGEVQAVDAAYNRISVRVEHVVPVVDGQGEPDTVDPKVEFTIEVCDNCMGTCDRLIKEIQLTNGGLRGSRKVKLPKTRRRRKKAVVEEPATPPAEGQELTNEADPPVEGAIVTDPITDPTADPNAAAQEF